MVKPLFVQDSSRDINFPQFSHKKVSPGSHDSPKLPSLHEALSFVLAITMVGAVMPVHGEIDRIADFLRMWLRLHKSSLAFWITVIPLISNQKPSRFLTSPIFLMRRKLNNNVSIKVWARTVTPEFCRNGKMQEHWIFFFFWHVGKVCRQFWVWKKLTKKCKCALLFWPQYRMFVLHFNLSLLYFIKTLFSDYNVAGILQAWLY